MNETPKDTDKKSPLHNPVDLNTTPGPTAMAELLEIYKNQSFMRIIAGNGVLQYKMQLLQLEPDRLNELDILKVMRESAELASDIATGKIQLVPLPDKDNEAQLEDFSTSDEDLDRCIDAIFTEVLMESEEGVKPLQAREYAPGARKRPPQKPVEEKMEGDPYMDTPLNDPDQQAAVGNDLSGNSRSSDTSRRGGRKVKVRKVVRPIT